MKKLAIIDDYEQVALGLADWSALDGDVEISVFHDHLYDEDEIAARLADFEIICMSDIAKSQGKQFLLRVSCNITKSLIE